MEMLTSTRFAMKDIIQITSTKNENWNTPSGHSPLSDFIQKVHPVSQDLIKYVDKNSFRYSIGKGKHLVKSGETCNYVYLVLKGVLRGYVKEGGKEITTWITAENEMVTSIRGFYQQIPTIKNIQALENCELIGAHFDDLQYLYDNYMEMNIVGRKLMEQYYTDAEERAFISRLPKATSRYNRFIATNGILANRIQLKYIASYLGITIETLSRIRGKMLNNNG
jgi:CRP-like cAMP-binding protein